MSKLNFETQVLSLGLFVVGLINSTLDSFIPAMVLGISLCMIWVGIMEVFTRYIRVRFDRLNEVSEQLGIPPLKAPEPFGLLKQAKTYIWLFAIIYILAWVLRLVLGFLI